MVDYFALALTHGLLALAAWRLVQRADLDRDPPAQAGDAAPDAKSAGGEDTKAARVRARRA
jgi:hypothetical protein